jgi:hypothetical protein
MICIYCKQPILETDNIFWLGFDIPYINLKVHKSCWKQYKNTNFVSENSMEILSYIKNNLKNRKK